MCNIVLLMPSGTITNTNTLKIAPTAAKAPTAAIAPIAATLQTTD